MAETIPAAYHDLLTEKKTIVHLATIMPDGTPQVSPVWVDFDGEHVLINSARGRVKDENMERSPHVALSMTDPDNPYRRLLIRGRVVEITEEGADAHIDKLSRKYTGREKYQSHVPGEARVIYRIQPESVSAAG